MHWCSEDVHPHILAEPKARLACLFSCTREAAGLCQQCSLSTCYDPSWRTSTGTANAEIGLLTTWLLLETAYLHLH